MEAFSSLHPWKIEHSSFSYHVECATLKSSHLVFADDLFILGQVEVESFATKKFMKEFICIPGCIQIRVRALSSLLLCLMMLMLRFIYFGNSRSTNSCEVSTGAIDCFEIETWG